MAVNCIMDYSSAKTCKEYANMQNATYDEKTGKILYGLPLSMKALGVNDGTSENLINPMLKLDNYKYGLGTAGGGCDAVKAFATCRNASGNVVENFDGKMNDYWFEMLVFVILVLSILHVCS